jgi:exonuclease III
MDKYHHLKIAHWNANSISSKINETYHFIKQQNIDILCVAETHLKEKNTIQKDPEYALYRFDRESRNKGGVAIIIKKSIGHTLLPYFKTKLLEAIGIEIMSENNKKLKVISIYLPGGSSNYLQFTK